MTARELEAQLRALPEECKDLPMGYHSNWSLFGIDYIKISHDDWFMYVEVDHFPNQGLYKPNT